MKPLTLAEAASFVKETGRVVIDTHGLNGPELPDPGQLRSMGTAVLDPTDLRGPIAISPDNLSAEFLAGTTIAELQAALAPYELCWSVDAAPDRTLGAVLATAGPHPGRTGYGPVRDWVLGVEAILAGGNRMRFGVAAMKNVAGYDLTRLLIGSRGTLGLIGSATLRLLPIPERQATVLLPRDEWPRAAGLAAACEWDASRLVVRIDGRESQVRRRLSLIGGETASSDAWTSWYAHSAGRYVYRDNPDWNSIGAPLTGLWHTTEPPVLSALEVRMRESIAPALCFNPHL